MLHQVTEEADKLELDDICQKMKLLSSGIIVNIVEVDKIDEESSSYSIKAKIKTVIDSIPVFSTITIKMTKQAVEKISKAKP